MNIQNILKTENFEALLNHIHNAKNICCLVKMIRNNEEYSNFLKKHTDYMPDDASVYYRILLLKNNIFSSDNLPRCKNCGKLLGDKDIRKYFQQNGCFCSKKCYDTYPKSEETLKKFSEHMKKQWSIRDDEYKKEFYGKVEKTNMERYNTKCTLNTEENIKKKKETWQKNYGEGVDNPLKAQVVKDKTMKTNNERFGSNCPLNCPEVKTKAQQTLYENFGVTNPAQSPIIIEKIRQTSREKHNTDCPSKSEEVWKKYCATLDSKNFKIPKYNKYHTYIFPSGKEVLLQGYEGLALDYYILKKYNEDDIENSISFMNSLNIKYKDDTGNEHRYIPDFYIKSENLFIEVKSAFTFYTDLTKISKKCKAALDKGYNIEVIVFEHVNRNKTNIKYNIYDYEGVIKEIENYK